MLNIQKISIFRLSVVGLSLFLILFFLVSCEQLLEEALTQDMTFEENLYDNETIGAEGQVISIVNNTQLSKEALSKVMCHMVQPVDIPDSDLFLEVVANGAGKITGSIKNNKGSSVVFGIYFSNTGGLGNPSEQATLIGTLNIDGFETLTIDGLDDFNQSREDVIVNMVSFFQANPGISTVYVYLTGDPDPVDLTIQSLQFVLNPCFHLSQSIEVNEEYTQYVDQIDDVSDVVIMGSVTNDGAGAITLILSISNGGGVWESIFIVEAEAIMQFADEFAQLTETDLDTLESILRYYVDPGEAIQVDLYVISEDDINVALNSIIFTGTITVLL